MRSPDYSALILLEWAQLYKTMTSKYEYECKMKIKREKERKREKKEITKKKARIRVEIFHKDDTLAFMHEMFLCTIDTLKQFVFLIMNVMHFELIVRIIRATDLNCQRNERTWFDARILDISCELIVLRNIWSGIFLRTKSF